MPLHTNMMNAALNAFEIAELAADNAYFAVSSERATTGRVHPATEDAWHTAVSNLNSARRAVQRATTHDRRH